jgi:hypothetical protein
MKDDEYLTGTVAAPEVVTLNQSAKESKFRTEPIGNLILVIFPGCAVTRSALHFIKDFDMDPDNLDKLKKKLSG